MIASARRTLLAATLLLPGLMHNASARESDIGQPVEISADRSEFDERAGTQLLEGNVDIRQGTMRIRADRIEVSLTNGRLAAIVGTGTPLSFEQENESGELMQGAASRIVYDAIEGSLVLEGGATLEQPRQSLTSDRIVVDTRTQTVRAEGNATDDSPGRVTIRLEPPPSGDEQ